MKRRHVYAAAAMISAFIVGMAVAWKQLRAAQARALNAPPQQSPQSK